MLIRLFLLLCLLISPCAIFADGWFYSKASDPIYMGINFRATSGYVTDGAGETYSLGEAYPTTRGGYTFGWDVGITAMSRDRNAAVDRRLAGVISVAPNQRTFRLDLPSTGTYQVCIGMGDYSYSTSEYYFQLLDNTTAFATRDDATGLTANQFSDSNGNEYNAATWPGSHTCVERTFTSTILNVKVNKGVAAGSCITHISVSK